MSDVTEEQLRQSRTDNQRHIDRVADYLDRVALDLQDRAFNHDRSKLEEPEASAFAQMENLRDLVYGSEEYKQKFREGPFPAAIKHHYECNDHHPEHFGGDIAKMNLMQLTEMLCDWKAASERHDNQPFAVSFPINRDRFQIDSQLYAVLVNTAVALGFITEAERDEYC